MFSHKVLRRQQPMRRLLIGLLLLALVVTGIPKGAGFTPEEKHFIVDRFSDGSMEKIVGLSGVSYNDTAKVTIPNNCTLDAASLRIETVYNENGEYPENLEVDIGSDGNLEYAFKGTGYGAFGKQNRLHDGRTSAEATIVPGAGAYYYLKIPSDAVVTNASFELEPPTSTRLLEIQLTNTYCEDAYVDSYYPTRNYGSSYYLLYYDPTTHTEYAYVKLKMDNILNRLPAGANIQTVYFYSYYIYVRYSFPYYWYQYWGAYRVTDSWSESSITWNNRPSDDGVRESYRRFYVSSSYNNQWAITNMFKYWMNNPSDNYGFVLKRYSPSSPPSPEDRHYNPRIYSSEYPSSTYRPRLRIYYTITVENPTVDVGDDGSTDWRYNGTLTERVIVENLSSAINTYLRGHFFDEVDEYGNRFTYVPLRLDADSSCFLTLRNIDIRYNYSHQILYNPYTGNLLNGWRENIPTEESGTTDIEINITSTNREGFVKLSGLYLEGDRPNYRPYMVGNIPDQSINEGEDHPQLINLAQYFSDDLTDPEEMTYIVLSYTNSSYVSLDISDGHYLDVTTIDDDWYGQVTGRVLALDSGGKSVISNEFTITVNSVNDPPRVITPVPDIVINEEGSYRFTIMKDGSPYFYDVEGDRIYVDYNLSATPLGLGFSQDEDYEKYIFTLSPETNFNTAETGPITVTLRVADRGDFSSFIYVTFTITVTSIDDPPGISTIPDVSLVEDSGVPATLDLRDYVRDPDTPFEELKISLSWDNPAISIDYSDGVAYISSAPNFNGIVPVTLQVADTLTEVTQLFRVRVASVNDPPEVFVNNLEDGLVIDGLYLIEGRAQDVDGYIRDVEVKVGESDWEAASGTFVWNFFLDIRVYPLGETEIRVRAYDGTAYSEEKVYTVILKNPYMEAAENQPPEVIVTSSLQGKLSGVVTIEGTASDDSGYVAKVEVKVDDGVWRLAVGTESWSYSLNTREYRAGEHTLYVRAFDGKIFGDPLEITITIDNYDSDGDGIPDADEERLKLDPFNPNDATFDYDGDGFTNYEEYKANTDIRNGNIHPLVEKEEKKEPISYWTMIFSALFMMALVLIAYSLVLRVERERVKWVEGIENMRMKARGPTFLQKMVKMKEAILPALFATPEAGPALPGTEEEGKAALPPAEGEVPPEAPPEGEVPPEAPAEGEVPPQA